MKLSAQIILAFSVIIILSAADSYTNYLLSKKVEQNSDFLSKSEDVIRNSNKIHREIINMQSSFRGYLLTEDTTFLEPYYSGIKKVPYYLSKQKSLISDNQTQLSILDSIGTLHNDWIRYSRELINSRSNMSSSYLKLFETRLKKHVGKKINDDISIKFNHFDRIEYGIRKRHSLALMTSIEQTHIISLIFLALTVIIGICSTIYIVLLITKRINSMVRLADDISKGNFTEVQDTKNDELTGLTKSLNIMSAALDKNIRELENRNAELNKFAYVVSHDLKAPIRGIHNVISWIEEDMENELSPEMKRYLAIIPQRTMRMEALINGLLDYARITHKTPYEEVGLNSLVHDIIDSVVPRTFQLEIGKLPTLYTERLKLEQVFANLISNAVKYTKDDHGSLQIFCKEYEKYYKFHVKDSGIGIDAKYHKKVFEIFQTLREKDEKESTGVGLAIVKKIMDEQKESIMIVSEAGNGAEFIFTWKK
jgi:signal transduction histidine kinase